MPHLHARRPRSNHELPEAVDGCEDCLATGGLWLHLRICLECGHVGCCDDSPNRHATAHARRHGAPDHPLARARRGLVLVLRRRGRACCIPAVHGTTRIPPSPLLG